MANREFEFDGHWQRAPPVNQQHLPQVERDHGRGPQGPSDSLCGDTPGGGGGGGWHKALGGGVQGGGVPPV